MFKHMRAITKESVMMYRTGAAAGLKMVHIQALEGALRHPEGLVPPPAGIPIPEHGKLLRELVAFGHAEIVRGVSFREEDVWCAEDGARLLRITESGVDAARDAASLFQSDDPLPAGEVPMGEAVVEPAAEAETAQQEEAGFAPMPEHVEPQSGPARDMASCSGDGPPIRTFKRSGACAKVMEMLRRRDGASIQEIMLATGWQAHTVRGFLSQLRKKGVHLEETVPGAAGRGRPIKFYRLGP